jgi:hypothetical protein
VDRTLRSPAERLGDLRDAQALAAQLAGALIDVRLRAGVLVDGHEASDQEGWTQPGCADAPAFRVVTGA